MGFFPNGTSFIVYDDEWCAGCVHGDGDANCPVIEAHLAHGYGDIPAAQDILDTLIPRDANGRSCRCAMFVPRKLSADTATTAAQDEGEVA